MSEAAYLAVDLGAGSGRAVLGRFDGTRTRLEELARFPNEPVRLPEGLRWDALRWHTEICTALGRAVRLEPALASVAVDSWAADFGLLDDRGELLGNPVHYRDARTAGMYERAFERVPREQIFAATGSHFMPFTTLCQLLALENTAQLERAEQLLLVPDLIAHWLGAEPGAEQTIASTTQLLDAAGGDWAWDLIERLRLPRGLLPALRPPGTQLGPLRAELRRETGAPVGVQVVSVASHDTASAVAAVPASGERFAYISSGTWSLVGCERSAPVLSADALGRNFANERGFGERVRLLRNVMGLWLVQECRRAWRRDRLYGYDELTALAAEAEWGGPLVDPDLPLFAGPGDMPTRIHEVCRATGQELPESVGAVVRCVLESLACKYRLVLDWMEAITGQTAEVVHVIGGGARNALLCQLTADVLGRPLLVGPDEATALGNVLVQAHADGRLGSLADVRAVARASFPPAVVEPRAAEHERWEDRYRAFRDAIEAQSEIPELVRR